MDGILVLITYVPGTGAIMTTEQVIAVAGGIGGMERRAADRGFVEVAGDELAPVLAEYEAEAGRPVVAGARAWRRQLPGHTTVIVYFPVEASAPVA